MDCKVVLKYLSIPTLFAAGAYLDRLCLLRLGLAFRQACRLGIQHQGDQSYEQMQLFSPLLNLASVYGGTISYLSAAYA